MGSRSAVNTLLRTYNPSTMAHLSEAIAKNFDLILTHESNKVVDGLGVGDPTTGSAQLTGTGNTTWSYNLAAGHCIVGGVQVELAAAVDAAIHSG